jgi:hypothetical protein
VTEDSRQLTPFDKLTIGVMTVAACLCILTISLAGCTNAQLERADAWAGATTRGEDSVGILATLATGNPVTGAMVSNLAFIGASVWLYIRKGKYKTALRTVVNTVEPFIPEDEPSRDKLKEAQGPTTTALVKKVKA